MKGVVIFPNGSSPYSIIQGDDGCICSVKVLDGSSLLFMHSVEINDFEPGSRGFVHCLATDTYVEVLFQRVSKEFSWDETRHGLENRKK